MRLRSTVIVPVTILLLSHISGCGGDAVTSPQPGELTQYLEENPDAPVSTGGEPEGLSGPGTVGQ